MQTFCDLSLGLVSKPEISFHSLPQYIEVQRSRPVKRDLGFWFAFRNSALEWPERAPILRLRTCSGELDDMLGYGQESRCVLVLSGDLGHTVPMLQFPQEWRGGWAGVFDSMLGG